MINTAGVLPRKENEGGDLEENCECHFASCSDLYCSCANSFMLCRCACAWGCGAFDVCGMHIDNVILCEQRLNYVMCAGNELWDEREEAEETRSADMAERCD